MPDGWEAFTRLGLGCWAFGGVGSKFRDDDRSRLIIRRAGALGVRHLDTAADYGRGASERVVGSAIAEDRERWFVATKTQLPAERGVIGGLVRSAAKRLGIDRIDLFYIHWPRRGVDPAPAMEELEACRREGLISFIGVSNFTTEDMERAGRGGHIDVHELCYNLLWRHPEKEVLPYCVERGIRVVAYSPLAQGLLADHWPESVRRRAADDPRGSTLYYRPDIFPLVSTAVNELASVARHAGTTLSASALRWVLSKKGITSAIAGASSLTQLEMNVAAVKDTAVSAEVDSTLLTRFDEISLGAMHGIPDIGNIFLYYP